MQNPSYNQLLGASRLVRPLQHVSILEEINSYLNQPKSYKFSIQLYSEIREAFLQWLEPLCPEVRQFPYFYLTSGILEGLNLEGNLGTEKIYFQQGDFSYFHQVNPHRLVEKQDLSELKSGDKLYASVPSSINGLADTSYLQNLPNITQVWDLAYACTVQEAASIAPSKNVVRMYCSLSKMIGEPALRQGFILSREPIAVLDFLIEKEYVSLLLAPFYIQIFSKFRLSFLSDELKTFQKEASNELGISASDCVLLGYTKRAEFDQWKRGDTNRIYLGQYMYERFPAVRKNFRIV